MNNFVNSIGALSMSSAPSSSSALPNVGQTLGTQKVEGSSFEDVLANVAHALNDKLGTAETLSLKQMSGDDVNIRDVVNSVMDAQRSLNTAVALRDKIVQSYLEISRMQI